MIVTVVSEGTGAAKLALAEHLAALRGLAGRKVLLMDADSHPHDSPCGKRVLPIAVRAVCGKSVQAELDNLGQRFQDIVVDADGRDSLGSRAALIAAKVAVIPAGDLHGDTARAARLAERIGNARLFNPGLRIVIVTNPVPDQVPDDERNRTLATLQRTLPGAQLASHPGVLYATVFGN
ncbi:cobyrinic acid ac-diamide synthase [Pseudoduganella armeniaca]|uniref:Cobyrinic acid ac-diamide synthase n=1 Tax=Pseudoduganella armeniaca TaxID=2072590 RepID=A0A2R4C6G5_9BURK|nr:cobyrinic acid ac-diamide synthase [Pseudoduganella armeniaca]AVR95217.1 cobyrinic acid ac-diamide synthase [Pseudoduganella armeniaca]